MATPETNTRKIIRRLEHAAIDKIENVGTRGHQQPSRTGMGTSDLRAPPSGFAESVCVA